MARIWSICYYRIMTSTFPITPTGPLPGIVIFGFMGAVYACVAVAYFFDSGAPRAGLWIATLIVATVAAFIGLFVFHNRSQAVRITDTELTLKAPFYGRSLPLAAIDATGIRVLNLETLTNDELKLVRRANGVSLPKLQLGWFRLGNGEKTWCYITDPTSVLYIPTTNGFSILLSVDSPDAVRAALTR